MYDPLSGAVQETRLEGRVSTMTLFEGVFFVLVLKNTTAQYDIFRLQNGNAASILQFEVEQPFLEGFRIHLVATEQDF